MSCTEPSRTSRHSSCAEPSGTVGVKLLLLLLRPVQGKSGAELQSAKEEVPLSRGKSMLSAEQLMRHGEFGQDPVQCHATLNELTYGD